MSLPRAFRTTLGTIPGQVPYICPDPRAVEHWRTKLSAHAGALKVGLAPIAALDIVIAIDTAVAHLAGALGKPVWLLLAAVPDWRWTPGAGALQWYPTARLFRQGRDGDREGVVAEASRALREARGARRES